MYKICVLVDKLYKFGGGEMFLEDLIKNSSKNLEFKYLISLENSNDSYFSNMPIQKLNFEKKNIKKVCLECDVLLFWGRVLDSIKNFSITKIMWAHSDYNVNFFLEKAEKYTNHYIACSKSVKKSIRKKNTTIIYPGIDPNRYAQSIFTKNQTRSLLGFDENDFIVGHFSSFGKVKNIPFLVNSISEIKDPNVKLLLVGHGNELNEIINLCEKKIPKRFQYLYYSDSYKISNLFKCLDAFCLPSYGEGYARVQWECAMFKIPFIGTEVGGTEGIINNYNGFKIKNKIDISNIVEKLKDKEFNKKIVSNSYDFFCSKGKIEFTISKIEKLIKNIINKKYKSFI